MRIVSADRRAGIQNEAAQPAMRRIGSSRGCQSNEIVTSGAGNGRGKLCIPARRFPVCRSGTLAIIALGYVCFRLLEGVIIVIGMMSILSLLTLSRAVANGVAPNDSLQTLGAIFIAVYKWALTLGPNFVLGVNTTMCASLLYKSGLVPRFIARMGLVGAALIFTAAVLELFGILLELSTLVALMALPIFAYEMTLAGWLIVKGFNSSPLLLNVVRDRADLEFPVRPLP